VKPHGGKRAELASIGRRFRLGDGDWEGISMLNFGEAGVLFQICCRHVAFLLAIWVTCNWNGILGAGCLRMHFVCLSLGFRILSRLLNFNEQAFDAVDASDE